ncbi:MAG: hypothetical protein KGI30_06715 [Planctomycetota bacterium]|nr:hypothetical protein [Planctomycetota bacterium]
MSLKNTPLALEWMPYRQYLTTMPMSTMPVSTPESEREINPWSIPSTIVWVIVDNNTQAAG